jgi:DNA-binding response OmpR family regulator
VALKVFHPGALWALSLRSSTWSSPARAVWPISVSLPDLNGLDLQQRIRADRGDLPIIFITGHGEVPMTVRAMKAGAVEFLTKPFGDEVLLDAIAGGADRRFELPSWLSREPLPFLGSNQDSPIISVCPLKDARPSRASTTQRAHGSSNPGSVPVRRKST